MRLLAMLRRARTLSVAGAVVLTLSTGVGAYADSVGHAQAKADSLLAKVKALQAKVQRAEQAYQRSLAGVAAGVNSAVLSEETTNNLAAQTRTAQAAFDERVRGLYMSGGPAALYVTLLQSGSATDLEDRAVMVGNIVHADKLLVSADQAVVAQSRARTAAANRMATRRIATERDVATVATRVMALLAREQQLLAQARTHAAALRAAYAAQAAAFGSITTTQVATMQVLPPSPQYLALYHRGALLCPGLSWTVLAAIGQVESGHGSNPSTSSAGAMGPMQFLPSTFAHYAVDGDHDGVANIMDAADAIFTAANYLCANGAGRGPTALPNAIWHYNHADWYVQMVLALATKYQNYAG